MDRRSSQFPFLRRYTPALLSSSPGPPWLSYSPSTLRRIHILDLCLNQKWRSNPGFASKNHGFNISFHRWGGTRLPGEVFHVGADIDTADNGEGGADRPTWFVDFGEAGVLYSPRILTGIPCKLRAVRVNESLATPGVVYFCRRQRQKTRHLGTTFSSPQSDRPPLPLHFLMPLSCNPPCLRVSPVLTSLRVNAESLDTYVHIFSVTSVLRGSRNVRTQTRGVLPEKRVYLAYGLTVREVRGLINICALSSRTKGRREGRRVQGKRLD